MKTLYNKFVNLEKNDRTMLLLVNTTIINIVIAIIKYIFAFTLPSLWFFINAIFMTILSISRFFSIKNYRYIRLNNNEKENKNIGYKNYLHNGILLVLLGIMYFFVSSYMYYKGTNTTMHKYLTYAVALNAFWGIGWAIHGKIKYHFKTSPILKSVKMTNFAYALTSIVLTQVVLLDTYASHLNLSKINGVTGMVVSLIIIIMGLFMIINTKDLHDF